jgi:hypothetical protein
VALGLGFASALVIVADIVLLGNRQYTATMDLAFPLTALYMGTDCSRIPTAAQAAPAAAQPKGDLAAAVAPHLGEDLRSVVDAADSLCQPVSGGDRG